MRVGSAFTAAAMPHLALAVQAVADRAEGTWKSFAAGSPMPNGKTVGNRSGSYLRSIMQRNTGDFSREIYTDLPYAQAIESGTPRRDLKSMLNSSVKVRISAAGHRYLIIPFRHSANSGNVARDNAMPAAVHAWWQDKKASSIINPMREMMEELFKSKFKDEDVYNTRPSGTGAYDPATRYVLQVKKHDYQWGDRLSRQTLSGLGVHGEAAKRMAGMVHFRQLGKQGGAAHSQYITFRVMSENSKGWIAPAQEGKWPARTTAEIYQPLAEQVFQAAVTEDVRRVMPGATTT